MGKNSQAVLAFLTAMAMIGGSSAFASSKIGGRGKRSTHRLMRPHIRTAKTRKKTSRGKRTPKAKAGTETETPSVE